EKARAAEQRRDEQAGKKSAGDRGCDIQQDRPRLLYPEDDGGQPAKNGAEDHHEQEAHALPLSNLTLVKAARARLFRLSSRKAPQYTVSQAIAISPTMMRYQAN